jgi:hypothetical protein
MNFLAPLALALSAFAAPIILLYMLRLRRRDMVISSNLLWSQVLRDREANAPWQRLRRNLLLILQLLILAALILALARPYIEVPTVISGRTALLIDASASMTATDVQPSRFEVARAQANAIIDSLGVNDSLTLIRVGAVPEVAQSYTSDRATLRSALGRLKVDSATPDWNAALTLAAAGYAGAEKFTILVLSDGGLPPNLPAIPGEIKYLPIGSQSVNSAISALAIADDPSGGPQLYAKVTHYGDTSAEVIFSLKLDDALHSAQTVTIPANGGADVIVSGLPKTFRRLEATISRPSTSTVPDYLAVDDSAYAVYNAGNAGRALLMTTRNRFLEQGLASLPGWQTFRGDVIKGLPTELYDLYIFDNYLPLTLPDANVLIINPPPGVATPLFTLTGTTKTPLRGGLARKDDLRTANLKWDNVNIRVAKTLTGASWATPLITSTSDSGEVAVVLAGEVNNRRVAILTFDLYDSDLPLQIAYPILLANLTSWFRTPKVIDLPNGLRTGETLTLRPALTADRIRVRRPDGATTTLLPAEGNLVFGDTTLPGLYTVEVYKGTDTIQTETFTVNLFDTLESRIAPATTLAIGTLTANAAQARELGQREYWPWIALIALIILVAEWYVYHQGSRPFALRRSR